MTLGVSVSGRRPALEAVEVAKLAEELGYEEVWLTEDYCERGAFAVAGAVAGATKNVRIGLGVLNPWTRHPMLTAMEVTALSELAPGRITLGMGASNEHWIERDLGIPFHRPLPVLEESVEVIRRALGGEHVTHGGNSFKVDTRLSFVSSGEPPPIVLGVKGPIALDMAARVADGLVLSVLSAPEYVAWVRKRVGNRMPIASYVVFSSDEDPLLARDRVRDIVATYLGIHGDHPIARVAGLDQETSNAFRKGWLDKNPRVDLVSDDVLDTFAVAGTPNGCVEGLGKLVDAGVDTLLIRDSGDPNPVSLLAAAADSYRRL